MTKPTLPVKHKTTTQTGSQTKPSAEPTDITSLQGRFKVGPGNPVEDVRKARDLMGIPTGPIPCE